MLGCYLESVPAGLIKEESIVKFQVLIMDLNQLNEKKTEVAKTDEEATKLEKKRWSTRNKACNGSRKTHYPRKAGGN